jgi:Pyruvate/2-oxoacid:ferredoxin oxidoreductase delta subunit
MSRNLRTLIRREVMLGDRTSTGIVIEPRSRSTATTRVARATKKATTKTKCLFCILFTSGDWLSDTWEKLENFASPCGGVGIGYRPIEILAPCQRQTNVKILVELEKQL